MTPATATRLRPGSVDDLRDAIADAARTGATLAIRGGASKDGVGRPEPLAQTLDMGGFCGVQDYDAPELMLTAGAATPLAEVQALLRQQGQMLAFAPFDHAPMFGRPAGAATLGGVVAAGVAGSQRLTQGGARDHLLGFQAVSGRGEVFIGGAKVVKNVTGYDLPKLMAGSWGRLAALTQVTLKVLPRPRLRTTRLLFGLTPAEAVRLMAEAMGSKAEVAAAAHLSRHPGFDGPLTALRLQGFPISVKARSAMLDTLLAGRGGVESLHEEACEAFWDEVATARPLPTAPPLWRINVAPSAAPSLLAALEPLEGTWLLDWAGGLVWIASEGDAQGVRTAAEAAGGHAMLVRGPLGLRTATPALQPPAPGVAALEARIRRAFDPSGVFETGRF